MSPADDPKGQARAGGKRHGMSPMLEPRPEQKSGGSRFTCRMTAGRVTTQKPGPLGFWGCEGNAQHRAASRRCQSGLGAAVSGSASASTGHGARSPTSRSAWRPVGKNSSEAVPVSMARAQTGSFGNKATTS